MFVGDVTNAQTLSERRWIAANRIVKIVLFEILVLGLALAVWKGGVFTAQHKWTILGTALISTLLIGGIYFPYLHFSKKKGYEEKDSTLYKTILVALAFATIIGLIVMGYKHNPEGTMNAVLATTGASILFILSLEFMIKCVLDEKAARKKAKEAWDEELHGDNAFLTKLAHARDTEFPHILEERDVTFQIYTNDGVTIYVPEGEKAPDYMVLTDKKATFSCRKMFCHEKGFYNVMHNAEGDLYLPVNEFFYSDSDNFRWSKLKK